MCMPAWGRGWSRSTINEFCNEDSHEKSKKAETFGYSKETNTKDITSGLQHPHSPNLGNCLLHFCHFPVLPSLASQHNEPDHTTHHNHNQKTPF